MTHNTMEKLDSRKEQVEVARKLTHKPQRIRLVNNCSPLSTPTCEDNKIYIISIISIIHTYAKSHNFAVIIHLKTSQLRIEQLALIEERKKSKECKICDS